MTSPAAPESTYSAVIYNEAPAENTPLLGESTPQKRTRRSSSVVGNIDHGYHTISGGIPEEPIQQQEHDFWHIFSILSVLLVGGLMDLFPSLSF
jgi:hypothetical protein